MKPTYTIREWEHLRYGNSEEGIPEGLADRLAALARKSPLSGAGENGVLEHGRRSLRARGVVGILATNECTLEILPKIDVLNEGSNSEQNAAIRKRLIHMLAVVLKLKVDLGSITDLAWQRETLLEILIHVFCGKLTDAIREGMPRHYMQRDDELSTLRGALNVVRQFTRNAINPARIACAFDDFSEDTPLNQIMKAAVTHLFEVSGSFSNQQRLRELSFVYADIAEISPAVLPWGEVAVDRTNRRWLDLLSMARLLLQGRYQTTTNGSSQGTALLFQMNALFEEYIGRLVSKASVGTGYDVSLQGGRLFCLAAEEGDNGLFQTRPDIIIRRAGLVTHVIDTKWKRIARRLDDPKMGVSQTDIYQMMAYAQLYSAPRLTLLYPHHAGLGTEEFVHARRCISGLATLIETASIDVADGANIVLRLRKLLNLDVVP